MENTHRIIYRLNSVFVVVVVGVLHIDLLKTPMKRTRTLPERPNFAKYIRALGTLAAYKSKIITVVHGHRESDLYIIRVFLSTDTIAMGMARTHVDR